MSEIKLPSLNKVLLTGVLVDDPEMVEGANVSEVKFMIMISRRYYSSQGEWREKKCYLQIVAQRHLADVCQQYLKKGNAVFIEGELQNVSQHVSVNDEFLPKIEVHAARIQMLNQIEDVSPKQTSTKKENEDLNQNNLETDSQLSTQFERFL